MKIAPITAKQKLLYTVGLFCAGLTACAAMVRQKAPGDVPNDNPQTKPEIEEQSKPENGNNKEASPEEEEIEELPQQLGGDVPYIPPTE